MRQFSIRRDRNGTWDTLQFIQSLGRQGSTNQYVILLTNSRPVREWDAVLRHYWLYEPEQEELLRTIPRQVQNVIQYQKLIGDCDDAAVVAVAMAEAKKRHQVTSSYPLLSYQIVAVRRSDEPQFSHVFVEILLGHQLWRIDPTAPTDADYTNWERLVL